MIPVDTIEVEEERNFLAAKAIRTNNRIPDNNAGSLMPDSVSPIVSISSLLYSVYGIQASLGA